MPLYDDLETRPVRLEPSYQEVDMLTLLRDAALAGTLGGAVSSAVSGVPGSMVSYDDWLSAQPKTRGRFSEDEIEALRAIAKKHDVFSRRMPAGYGLEGEFRYFPSSPIKRTEEADWKTKSGRRAVVRTKHRGGRATNVARDALVEDLAGGGRTVRPGRSIQGGTPIVSVQPREVPVKPTRAARAKQILKAGARGLFNPVKIAADMLAGGAMGAGSAALGHKAGGGDRESAGLFTPPGEGYEGLVRAEDIERVIAQKELEKEVERQRLLEQYRASGYDLDPNTRLSELR